MVLYNAAEWRDRRRPSPPEAEVPNTKQRKIPSKRPLQPSTTETPLFLWSSHKAENSLVKVMLFSVEQAFVGRDEKRTPLKTSAWEATHSLDKIERLRLRRSCSSGFCARSETQSIPKEVRSQVTWYQNEILYQNEGFIRIEFRNDLYKNEMSFRYHVLTQTEEYMEMK